MRFFSDNERDFSLKYELVGSCDEVKVCNYVMLYVHDGIICKNVNHVFYAFCVVVTPTLPTPPTYT